MDPKSGLKLCPGSEGTLGRPTVGSACLTSSPGRRETFVVLCSHGGQSQRSEKLWEAQTGTGFLSILGPGRLRTPRVWSSEMTSQGPSREIATFRSLGLQPTGRVPATLRCVLADYGNLTSARKRDPTITYGGSTVRKRKCKLNVHDWQATSEQTDLLRKRRHLTQINKYL